jgi:molecular chaperone GrpE
MSESDAPNQEAKDQSGGQAAVGAEQWTKTVVDGLRSDGEPSDPSSPPPADEQAGSQPGWWVDGQPEGTDDQIVDAEVVDAEVVDAEVVDAEVVDTEAADADAEVVDDATNSEVVDAEVVDTDPADVSGATAAAAPADEESPGGDISVEDLVIDLERVTTERDQYLDASRRLQAEFENYKKQVAKREAEARERANDSLIGELLPVLDAFDGAVANGAEDVAPMRTTFLDAMTKQGLERIDPTDAPFDPNLHEAVMHEDASDTDGPVVAEVMRAGYVWKGRVLRPAMVRTRG